MMAQTLKKLDENADNSIEGGRLWTDQMDMHSWGGDWDYLPLRVISTEDQTGNFKEGKSVRNVEF